MKSECISDHLSNFEIEDDIPQMSLLFDSNWKTFTCNTLRLNENVPKPDPRYVKSSISKLKKGFNEKNTKAVSIIINNEKTCDISSLKELRPANNR